MVCLLRKWFHTLFSSTKPMNTTAKTVTNAYLNHVDALMKSQMLVKNFFIRPSLLLYYYNRCIVPMRYSSP